MSRRDHGHRANLSGGLWKSLRCLRRILWEVVRIDPRLEVVPILLKETLKERTSKMRDVRCEMQGE